MNDTASLYCYDTTQSGRRLAAWNQICIERGWPCIRAWWSRAHWLGADLATIDIDLTTVAGVRPFTRDEQGFFAWLLKTATNGDALVEVSETHIAAEVPFWVLHDLFWHALFWLRDRFPEKERAIIE